MNISIERLDELAKCADRLREAFTVIESYPMATAMRDLYLLVAEKRDELKNKPCKECNGSGKSERS